MSSHLSHVMTLANGIIGVSVLAMPFCFKECGIILSIILLLLSSIMSRLACHFLIKSAVMSRRRNYEFLAFHTFGHMGKFFVELFTIGFLFGTCIAFFVVVGDLGPEIIGKVIERNPASIRTGFLITTAIFIVFPLGLLRNINSLASISLMTIGFYVCLVLKVFGESTTHIFAGDWYEHVHFWRPDGVLQCLPIFSMALFCQTQLFEIHESVPNVSLEKMNGIVKSALNICTAVYLSVGLFGYIACCTQPFGGNILLCFEASPSSEVIKMCFVFSVAFSFPLVIFPCRASLNSLLFRRSHLHEASSNYMPETRFRFLTLIIVFVSLTVGIIIPNIEFVLGIVGSTIGVMICLVFPAAIFISISNKNTNERLLAHVIVFVGLTIMLLSTYVNLYAMESSGNSHIETPVEKPPKQILSYEIPVIPNILKVPDDLNNKIDMPVISNLNIPVKNSEIRNSPKIINVLSVEKSQTTPKLNLEPTKINILDSHSDMRFMNGHNINQDNERKEGIDESDQTIIKAEKVSPLRHESDKMIHTSKNENLIDSDAIKKEESELAADRELSQMEVAQRNEELWKTLEKHKLEQMEMIKEQKKILKEFKELNEQNQELKIKKTEQKTSEKEAASVINVKERNEGVERKRFSEEYLPKEDGSNIKSLHDDEKLLVHEEILERKYQSNNARHGNESEKQGLISINGEKVKDIKKSSELNKNDEVIIKDEKLKNDMSENEKYIKKHLINATASAILIDETRELNENLLRNNNGKMNNSVRMETGSDKKKTDRLQEYSIPIALKMRDQTKGSNDSKIHGDQDQFSAVRRDILENHEREKRESETYFMPNSLAVKKEQNDEIQKTCSRRDSNDEKSPLGKESEGGNLRNAFIKTNSHLSQQSFNYKISIESVLTADGKTGDLEHKDLKLLNLDKHGTL